MAAWDYESGGSTIVAENMLQALMNSVILASDLEDEANVGVETPTDNFSFKVEGDSAKVFAATVKIPGRLVYDAVTNRTTLKPKNVFIDQLPDYAAGTGSLAGTANLPEGIVQLGELSTYWERQVKQSIVTKTPNQITVTPNLETSNFDLTLNIPVSVKLDRVTGLTALKVDDYFYILGVQAP